jgi:hypothetical protein
VFAIIGVRDDVLYASKTLDYSLDEDSAGSQLNLSWTVLLWPSSAALGIHTPRARLWRMSANRFSFWAKSNRGVVVRWLSGPTIFTASATSTSRISAPLPQGLGCVYSRGVTT